MSNQSADEAAILALIHRNRIAVWMQDFDMYEKCFVHDPDTTRWNASPVAGILVRQGWDDISAAARRMFEAYAGQTHHANAYDTEVLDLRIRVSGDMAWASYRQKYPRAEPPAGWEPTRPWDHAGNAPSHEVRIFERHGGEWRIAFLGYLDPDSRRSSAALLRLAPDGTVEWQNEAATAVLASDDDLVIRNGRLRIRDGKIDTQLQAAIKWAAALSAPMVPSRGALPIVTQAGEDMAAKVWWVIAESGKILVSLGDPSQDEHRLEAASIVYGLSPAQRTVAGHILAGRTLTDIALAMGITANTARTHLDRIYDKTGVRTQPALVRALLSTAAPR
jgi:DNA-binding CsgD family transcriptional regulator